MAHLNLLFTGVAVVVAAVVEVFKSPWMVSAALVAPAAVIFPRSAPDDGKKPEGKGNTSTFNKDGQRGFLGTGSVGAHVQPAWRRL